MVIREFLRRYGWAYIPGLILLTLNSYVQSLAPGALGAAIDTLSHPSPERNLLLRQAGFIALIGVIVFASRFIWRLLIIGAARRMECFLREKLYLKLQELPISFFQKQTSGDLMAYAINDVGAVRMTFGPVLAQSFNGIVIAVLSIAGMVREVDLKMTLLALAPVPFATAATILFGRMVQKRFGRVQKLFSSISGFVNESINGIKVTKAFAKESVREKDFTRLSDEMRDANTKLADVSSLINPSVTAAFGLSYAVALIFGGNAVIAGTMGAGTLVTFLGYLLLVQQPIVQLGNIINQIQRGLASYKRLNDVFSEPSIPAFENNFNQSLSENFTPDIEAQGISYQYEDAPAAALSDISFTIKPGGSLGITGSTGSGKTTLLSIIAKLRYADSGSLQIAGQAIQTIPAYTLRTKIGYVPQDGFLFSATIAENIALGSQDELDMARVRSCAAKACIGDEIDRFPEGYQTQVGERGTHLSGGQKQRVSLARALYNNPSLLLLDDTLSAVDNNTEKRLVESLGLNASDGITKIIVSHRLSALEHCDEILHLENGRIIERGTHSQLIASGGAYASTWQKQTESDDRT